MRLLIFRRVDRKLGAEAPGEAQGPKNGRTQHRDRQPDCDRHHFGEGTGERNANTENDAEAIEEHKDDPCGVGASKQPDGKRDLPADELATESAAADQMPVSSNTMT